MAEKPSPLALYDKIAAKLGFCWPAMDMFRDPKVWRRVVNERLFLVRQDLAYFRGPERERASLEHRVRLLEEELQRLDQEEGERGTQWSDPETGRSADM